MQLREFYKWFKTFGILYYYECNFFKLLGNLFNQKNDNKDCFYIIYSKAIFCAQYATFIFITFFDSNCIFDRVILIQKKIKKKGDA